MGLSELSMERVLAWDPDILVMDFGRPEDLYKDPKWKSVKAVRSGQVFKQPVGVFIWDRPTAEAAVLYPLWLAKMAYPESFTEMDLPREVKRFYMECMSFQLSDAQAHALLDGTFGIAFNNTPGRR